MMSWERELEATRAKVESLGGCDTSPEASAIMDHIDSLLLELKDVVCPTRTEAIRIIGIYEFTSPS